MTKKKNDNVLDLPPMTSTLSASKAGLVPWRSYSALTEDERRLVQEARMQHLAIEFTAAKSRFSVIKIGEIHQAASQTFDETTNSIIEIKDQPGRTQEHQAYIDQFSARQIQLLAQHTFAATDIGASGVANEADRSTYPPPPAPEPEEEPGWFERLFGT